MRSDLKIRTTVNSAVRAPSAEASEHVLNLASSDTTNESNSLKENININKSETPTLSVEPLKMKRKKKGGGNNLRKSLAWDKAFFTEEGVLDSIELSVISGASRRGVPFVNGDTRPIKHFNMQKLERDLLKEMQDEDLSRADENDFSLPKIDSFSSDTVPSTPLTSHRPATHFVNRSGSRCGDCPRPLPSSSLKRPAHINVGKASGKDLKLLKLPGLKPTLSPICATTRSTIPRATSLKHNHITKPDFNIHKNPESKSCSKSLQSASKSSSLRPPRYSDGNSGNSSSKRLSSINMNQVLVGNTDNLVSEMISDIEIPVRPVNSSKAQQESTSFESPFSRNVHVCGTTIHPLLNQPVKPSGLRMPSPSLSFFGQPKRSIAHDLPLRDKEADACRFQKLENSILHENFKRTGQIDTTSKAINSTSERMESSRVSAVEVIRPNMGQKSMQKIPDISQNRTGRITHAERELQNVDIELPSESRNHEQVMDDNDFRKAMEGYREEACKSMNSLGETRKRTDKGKNILKTKGSSSASLEALKHNRVKAESSHFGSSEETVLTEVSTDIILVSEVDDDTNRSGKDMGPSKNIDSNSSYRSLPEKQLCHESTERENIEKLKFVATDRKDGKKVMDTKTTNYPSPSKMHNCNFGKDKMIGQRLISTEFEYVDNSLSSESHVNLVDMSLIRDFKCRANELSNNPSTENLSNNLHQDTQKPEIAYCSSFPEIRTCQWSHENTLGNVQHGSGDNHLTLVQALEEIESGMDNLRDLPNQWSVVVQSPKSLHECCVKESEGSILPSTELIAENVVHHYERLDLEDYVPTKCEYDVSHVDDARESTEGYVTIQTELQLSTSISNGLSAKGTYLVRDEECDDGNGVRVSTVESFSDINKSEFPEDDKSSFSCLNPKLDHARVEDASTPTDKNGNNLNEKSCLSVVLPQKAIPFSDEWLAAIEAAGEDILTKKSGAVQNSPPDKSLPEPGPWSPVKRKNNPIGPFDCTKHTNVVPSL